MDKPKSIILIGPQGVPKTGMAKREINHPGVVYVSPQLEITIAQNEVLSGHYGFAQATLAAGRQIAERRINELVQRGLHQRSPFVINLLSTPGDVQTPKFFDLYLNADRELHVRVVWGDPVNGFDQILKDETGEYSLSRTRDFRDFFTAYQGNPFRGFLSTYTVVPDLVKTFVAAPFIETVTLYEHDAATNSPIERASWVKGKPSHQFAPVDRLAFERLAKIDLETAAFDAVARKPRGKAPWDIELTVTNLYGPEFPPLRPDRTGPAKPFVQDVGWTC